MRLSSSQLNGFNQAIRDLYAAAWTKELPRKIPVILAQLVPSDLSLIHFFPKRGVQGTVLTGAHVPRQREIFAAFNQVAHEHPCLGRRTTARSISDLLSRRQWHRTGLYAEVIRQLGAEDDLGLDVKLRSGASLSCVLLRKAWTFRPEDHGLLDLFGPHLREALQQHETAKDVRMSGHLSEAVERLAGRGVVRVDERGRVLEITARSRRQIERFTGGPWRGSRLPSPLLEWFCQQGTEVHDRQAGPRKTPGTSLQFHLENAVLSVQFAADLVRRQYCLIITETSRMAEPAQLRLPGLSPREQEVLFWVAQGKDNQCIAKILGISLHTVKRHLERIYARLEVDGRHAATQRVHEFLQAPGS